MMTITVNNGKKNWIIRQHKDSGWTDLARIVIDESEIHTFIETFLKGVSGLAMFPEKTTESSGHSFTEGFDNLHDEMKDIWMKSNPTIDDQIEFMETVKNNLVVPFKFKAEISAIINNLRLTQVFEHQRMLIQNINFEGLIEKLIRVLKTANRSDLPGYEDAVANAETALGMIDAFKQKSGPPEWVKRYGYVKSESTSNNTYAYPPKWEEYREVVVHGILSKLPTHISIFSSQAIANAIIFAIEEMDKLKSK